MGRSLKIAINSAHDLRNADEDEGGESDPYVIVCFDNKVDQELCRTKTAEDTSSPEWNETFDVDVTKHIETVIEETGEEPKTITFCVYDGDADGSEPLGVAGIPFEDLVRKGKIEGDLDVYQGSGVINASVEMKKVKIGSMLTQDAAVKIAGGVAGVAALGAIGGYLYTKHKKKKDKLQEREGEDAEVNTGLVYGYDVEDEEEDDEEKGHMKKWWEMEDEDEEEDEEENRWTDDQFY